MSNAFENTPWSNDRPAAGRGREAVRQNRDPAPARLDHAPRPAPLRPGASARFPNDGGEAEHRYMRRAARPMAAEPALQRAESIVTPRWLASTAILVAAGIGLVVFARPSIVGTGAPKGSVGEAQPSPPAAAQPTPTAEREAPAQPKLSIAPATPRQAGEATPLGVSVGDSRGGGLVVVSGLAEGATLSAGTQADDKSWWLSFAELRGARIAPPPKFSGAMDIAFELRLPDASVGERKTQRFEWLDGSAAATAQWEDPAAEDLAATLKRAQSLISTGDVAAARQALRQAAEPEAEAANVAEPAKKLAPAADDGAPPGQAEDAGAAKAEEAKAEPKPAKTASLADERYTAGCYVKIDGRVTFSGRCPIVWTKAPSVTFQLARKPVTLSRVHGRTWNMTWGGNAFATVYKRGSCWGSRRVYICERES